MAEVAPTPRSHQWPAGLPAGTRVFVHEHGRRCWLADLLGWVHQRDAGPGSQSCGRVHPPQLVRTHPEGPRPHHQLCDGPANHAGVCRCRCGGPAARVAPRCAWHTRATTPCACNRLGIHDLTDQCGVPGAVAAGGLEDCWKGDCPLRYHKVGHPHGEPTPAQLGLPAYAVEHPAHEVRLTGLEPDFFDVDDDAAVLADDIVKGFREAGAGTRPVDLADLAYQTAEFLLELGYRLPGDGEG